MTLEQAGKRFGVSVHTLEKYVSYGFIKQIKTNGISAIYNDTDFEQLGLIDTLLSTGFTPEETKKYLLLTENMGTDEEQIRMLKKQRRSLLDDIHQKQQLLDNLDYMIWNKKNKA